MNEETVMLDVNKIIENKNIIYDKDAINELAEDIKKRGLVMPISVHRDGETFSIISGSRRFIACKLAGLKEVPVIIKTYEDDSV